MKNYPTQIPYEMNWDGPRPRGYYNQFKEWQISPYSSSTMWTPQNIVRFRYEVTQGVMDPYRSNLQFQVETDTNLCPVGGLQVDTSAHGFISQLVIQNRSVQIQRITQYDVLSAILIDTGQDPDCCKWKQFQGLGHVQLGTNNAYLKSSSNSSTSILHPIQDSQFMVQSNVNLGLTAPTRAGFSSGARSVYSMNLINAWNPNLVNSSCGTQLLSISNPVFFGGTQWQTTGIKRQFLNKPVTMLNDMIARSGRLTNVRSQYLSQLRNNSYPQTHDSILPLNPIVTGQTYDTTSFANFMLTGYNKNNPYNITFAQKQFKFFQRRGNVPGQGYLQQNIPNTPLFRGFSNPYAQAFMVGANQPMISPTIPQCQMQWGKILDRKIPVSKQRFQVPILSSILGVLIPADMFLLIPSMALYDTLVQITLNPYAMFTTGYRDIHQFDTIGMKYQQDRRGWYITQFYWNIHLYTFNQQNVRNHITDSLSRGISISTNYFQMANMINVASGNSICNRWNVMVLSESLAQIYVRFYPLQYTLYSFLRKHFALSNMVNQMQIKFNAQYWPQQPIVGNAGNPRILDTTGNCLPYLKQIYWSQNFMHNTNRSMPRINKYNFCINSRIFDPTNKLTLYPKAMLDVIDDYGQPLDISNVNWTSAAFNYDTAMGMSHFHQNRYIGRALYIWTWQPYGHGKTFLYGLNVSGSNQLYVIFNANTQNTPYTKDQVIYIFARSNGMNVYRTNGIQVWGR